MSAEDLPQCIGKYKIKRKLGEGAMGVVYEGMDEAIERRVAIKTLHSHLLNKRDADDFLERFKREAISAARCVHPNIVLVLEYGEDHGVPFIAMEFVDGIPLQDLILKGRPISINTALTIISQLLKAIHAAHALGVIHRDIKTANIMLCKKDNSVKLADFGIARINESASMTLTGAVVGTPRYMAPEQMFGLKVDSRADLFSIAMVLSELLSLVPPIKGLAMRKLPILEGLPQNNKINYACEYPDALIAVLQKGLAVKPDYRFQTAKDFARAIQQALPRLRKGKPADGNTQAQLSTAVTEQNQMLNASMDTLTKILSDYIGPVARNVMQEYSTQHDSLPDLVTSVAREIPDESQRQAFIKDWEKETFSRPNASVSRSGLSSGQGSGLGRSNLSGASSLRLDDNMIQKISNDYVNYMGPFAPRLVDYYCAESSDKEQFLNNLASEIPEQSSRDEFLKKWSLA